MKIVGIIPARFASTRFPGKPLQLLNDRPLIQWVSDVVAKSSLLSDFYVATDHEGIAEVCKKINVKYIMTSPDTATGTDRVFEASQILKKNGIEFDVVINIQGDEPLLPVEYIDLLAQAFIKEPSLQMATLAHPLSYDDVENKNAVKVLIDQNQYAIYFSRFPIPFSREKYSSSPSVQKHVGLYGFNSDFLKNFCVQPQTLIEKSESLEQLRALDMGIRIKVMSVDKPTHGVDTPEDLEKIEQLLKSGKIV